MKKIRAWIIMGAACMAVILSLPEDYGAVMSYAGAGLMQFLWNLIPVFLCVGLMDVWVEKEKMIKIIGEKSGLTVKVLSLFMGMLTAVPIYALLPIAGLLIKKGGRISNVLIFLCSSVSIRIPLLLFETSALGWKFSICRFLLNLPVVLVIGCAIERVLSDKDIEDIIQLLLR